MYVEQSSGWILSHPMLVASTEEADVDPVTTPEMVAGTIGLVLAGLVRVILVGRGDA
jgi:hypothetical protein